MQNQEKENQMGSSRIVKFRAWNKEKKVMTILESQYVSEALHYYEKGLHELMQSTGLLDKNGKEIYESDYLGDYCVFWGSGKYILQNISTGDIIDCNENTTYNKEVTGNRYENPREHKAMASDL